MAVSKITFQETTLSAQSIKDYQICSLLYDYRHVQDQYEPVYGRELLAKRYEDTLKKVVSFFFYKKLSGNTPSYNSILNRWEKLWFPKEMTAYDIAVDQHESWHGNLVSYNTDAALALLKFYEDFLDDPWEPLLIEEKFLVPITREIRLSGVFDLILRKGDLHKVIKYSGKLRRPSVSTLLIDFALLRHAFESRNDKPKKVEYALYDIGSSKPGFVKVRPTKKDLNALKYWANEVASTQVYAPRRGLTAYCKGCPFDKPCSNWNGYPNPEDE